MVEKKPKVRKNARGEKIRHDPDGTMHLVHDHSPLKERLTDNLEENRRRHAELKEGHGVAIRRKVNASKAGGVPAEKMPIA
jgi:hypothetical protein